VFPGARRTGGGGIGAAYSSVEENLLAAAIQDGTTQASRGTSPTPTSRRQPPERQDRQGVAQPAVPRGNLIGGWAHSRDLMYASKLFTSYNTEAKIFETLTSRKPAVINTIQLDPACWAPITKYNQQRTPKIQTMVCVPLLEDKTQMNEQIKRQVDLGATLVTRTAGRPTRS